MYYHLIDLHLIVSSMNKLTRPLEKAVEKLVVGPGLVFVGHIAQVPPGDQLVTTLLAVDLMNASTVPGYVAAAPAVSPTPVLSPWPRSPAE